MTNGSLESIRRAELDAARRVEAAKAEATAMVAEAHRAAQQRVERAREEGAEQADRRFRETIAAARTKAASITPDDRIATVIALVEPRLPALVDSIVELVMSPPSGKEA